MPDLVEEISRQALALAPQERVRLAEELLATVHQAPDAAVDAAWDEEIRRRLDEVDNAGAALIPAEEVFTELRRLIK